MPPRLRYICRATSLFFQLFILRSLKVMLLPGARPEGEPAPAPPVVSRAEQGDIHLLTLGLSLVVIFCVALPYLWGGSGRPYIAIAGFVALAVGYQAWKTLGGGASGLCRQASENDYCLCLICGYCLKGLPEKHRCPECGTPYEIEDVKRHWSEYLGDRAARRPPW